MWEIHRRFLMRHLTNNYNEFHNYLFPKVKAFLLANLTTLKRTYVTLKKNNTLSRVSIARIS